MTTERDKDTEATVRMPRPAPPKVDDELEDVDPEKTLVREDWESTVIRRVAPRVAEVQDDIEGDERRFGWEHEVLRRLSRELPR
jgi:hypothetical protein